MKLFIYITVLTLVFSCRKMQVEKTQFEEIPVPWNDTSANHPRQAAFRNLIDKYTKAGLPGISLLIRDENGTWIGSAGNADLTENIPFKLGTVSKAASITKLFVGTLVFKLIEDSTRSGLGYRDLHKPIATWLPSNVASKVANSNNATLGHLLKHESGIDDIIEQDPFYLAILNHPNKIWKPEELLSFIYNKPALFNAGDTAIYSNTNTLIVSMIIEKVTGRKHADLLKEYIFTPLNLNHTYYPTHDVLPNSVAQGYYDLYGNGTIVNVSNLVTGSGHGYGGMYSNIFDLQVFVDHLLLKRTLLSAKSMTYMETYGKTDDPNQYGYGLMKKFIERGINAGLGHSGRDLGYTANMFYFPNKKVTHIFFINYGSDSDSDLKKVFNAFQEELLDITLQ